MPYFAAWSQAVWMASMQRARAFSSVSPLAPNRFDGRRAARGERDSGGGEKLAARERHGSTPWGLWMTPSVEPARADVKRVSLQASARALQFTGRERAPARPGGQRREKDR